MIDLLPTFLFYVFAGVLLLFSDRASFSGTPREWWGAAADVLAALPAELQQVIEENK